MTYTDTPGQPEGAGQARALVSCWNGQPSPTDCSHCWAAVV
jgi:hypothetical protein